MSTIQKKQPSLTISKHAVERIEKRIGMTGHPLSELKVRLTEAIAAGVYVEHQPPNRSVFKCWMETDRRKREQLFIVISNDNCVLTIIDKHSLFKNRERRWNE